MLWYEDAGTSQRRWADLDERGSTTRITNDAGATLWINTYDEYGIPGAGNGGRFQYTGQAWLPSLGLYNYKARIYSPTFGRFLQTDPIGVAAMAELPGSASARSSNMHSPTATIVAAFTIRRLCRNSGR